MKENKLVSYLGFAIKSGKVIFGIDNLLVAKKIPQLTIICSSQNDKVTDKIIRFCDKNCIKCIKLTNLLLSDLIYRDNCKVISILDTNLSQVIEKELEMEILNS